MTEGRKIAAMAETYHRPFAPHDCTGPVGFVAAVHASLSQPNTLIQESVRAFYTGWYKELVTVVPTSPEVGVLGRKGSATDAALVAREFCHSFNCGGGASWGASMRQRCRS